MTTKVDWQQIRERSKRLALLLALTAGVLRISELWTVPLSQYTLIQAGFGVVLLLIALGLMGATRLALVLACLFCTNTLFKLEHGMGALVIVNWVELGLLVSALTALFIVVPINREP